MTETEIKLRVLDRNEMARRLAGSGWEVRTQRQLERNLVYDQQDGPLQSVGCLLRVREEAGGCRLTFKGQVEDGGRHKVREEHEVKVDDASALQGILEGLGYQIVWRYEKFRTCYQRDGDGKLLLDETPIGDFIELEGDAEWIDATAAELGYSVSDYLTASYGALFAEYRAQNRGAPVDMVF